MAEKVVIDDKCAEAEKILIDALKQISDMGCTAYLRDTEWRVQRGYEITPKMVNIELS